jgi:hypothetical protein
VLGIEPGTNYPNPRSFENQHRRVVWLKAGEKWRAEVTAIWHADSGPISEEEKSIRAIQGERSPNRCIVPRAAWSS